MTVCSIGDLTRRHKYIIHTEGNTESERLKYHLLCGSVIISHPLKVGYRGRALSDTNRLLGCHKQEGNTLSRLYVPIQNHPSPGEGVHSVSRACCLWG